MKRLVLLFTLAMVCSSVFSQKIVKDEKDEFTGRQVIETSYASFSDAFNCMIRVSHNTPFLHVVFNAGGECLSMDEGAEFMLKLENDSIITLKNMEYSIAELFKMGNISHFNLKTRYVLYDESLIELKKYKIVKVRFVTTDGYIERKVSKGNATKLLKLFNLV